MVNLEHTMEVIPAPNGDTSGKSSVPFSYGGCPRTATHPWWCQHVSPRAQLSMGWLLRLPKAAWGASLSAVLSEDSSWLTLKSPPSLNAADCKQQGQAFNFSWVPLVPSKSLLPLICSQYLLKISRRVKCRNDLLPSSPLYRKLCDCVTRDLVFGSR